MSSITTMHPLPLSDVTIDDEFWSARREIVRRTMLPRQEHQLRTHGQLDALRLSWRPGDDNEPHIFWESDVAKWIEAASSVLAVSPDPALEASVDEAIELLAGAQQPDGYLNVYFTVVRPGERFTDLQDAHELYCLGHLIEAAVAHHQATGRTTLLDIVRRYADLVDREFGPGGSCEGGYDGHQEIELALVKLARETGETRYRDLALRLIDARGTSPAFFELQRERRGGRPGYFDDVFGPRPGDARDAERWREYHQSHRPVREQDEAVGHSVRLMYLVMAMADLAVEMDDDDLLAACRRLWESVAGTKLYLTGGLGADPSIEGFSAPFDLPTYTGYGETCAAIGLVMWAQRMANITRDAQYADVMERALYNGVLSGGSADGTSYFYGNPLASRGDVHRHEWFGVACCPPNLARLLTSLPSYVYAQDADHLTVHLYVAGTVRTTAGGGARVSVETAMPREGTVRLVVSPDQSGARWTLALRVPGWSQHTVLRINGEPVDLAGVTDRGYAHLERVWHDGDVVELDLDLSVARVHADPRVVQTAGMVALQRGPVVYCLEGVDHDVPVHLLALPREAHPRLEGIEPMAGLPAVVVDGLADVDDDESGSAGLYRRGPVRRRVVSLRAVPYFAWANRGRSTMTVWIREA